MYKAMTNKMCVVKKYHTLINKETGYADLVRVGFLPFRLIFSLDFERKLNTGCGKAFQIAFPNRQGVALPINGLASSLSSERHEQRKTESPQRATNAVQAPVAGFLSLSWGFVQGGYSPLCLLAPLEKRKQQIKIYHYGNKS